MERNIRVLSVSAVLPAAAALCLAVPVSASFNDSGYAARQAAMGQAFTAIADDSGSVPANPAGLINLSGPELTAVYGKLYQGLSDDSDIGRGYFGFASPVKRWLPGAAAFSWDETRLTEAYAETSFSVSYATRAWRGLATGMTLKYLRKGYEADSYTAMDPLFSGGYSKAALGVDLGAHYRLSPKYTFGLLLRNLNRPDLGIGEKDALPAQGRLGAAYWLRNGVVSADAGFGEDFELALGAEYVLHHRYPLRLGLNVNDDARRNVSFGLGARMASFGLDYSFTLPIGGVQDISGSHLLAFSMRFGQPDAGFYAAQADPALAGQLQDALRALKAAEQRERDRERELMDLERRLLEKQRSAREPAPAGDTMPHGVPEPKVIVPSQEIPGESIRALEETLNALKGELEKARRESESFKARVSGLEERLKTAPKAAAPAPAARPAAPAPAPAARRTYEAQKGDTLQSIAEKVYGDASRWPEIYRANAASLGRGGEVKPGQVLVIP
ncbi:MAG: LysM peptidoglycan-binding domain-containing protein [Elusimicrobiota bacterium]